MLWVVDTGMPIVVNTPLVISRPLIGSRKAAQRAAFLRGA
jgi:hypothetical protein